MIMCGQCKQPATIHITQVLEPRARTVEFHLCEKHARELLSDQNLHDNPEWCTWSRAEELAEGAIAFDIDMIIISELGDQQVVYLRELGGKRRFPFVIGLFEATALDRNLKGIQSPRPLTHAAWASTIPPLGGEIRDVYVYELREHTFFANIRIEQAGHLVEIDVRPSDALNVALVGDAPIYVAKALVDEVCA